MKLFMMKHFIKKSLAKASSVSAQWHSSDFLHERKLRAVFKRFDIRYVIDVGANEGQFGDFLRMKVGFKGEIHSFEPITALAKTIKSRHRKDDSAWLVHECALGSAQGEQEINVMNSTVFSSFLEPRHDVIPGFTQWNSVASREKVTVTTLDHYVSRLGKAIDLRHTFLKLDTQGYDLEVLKGGTAAVAEIPVVQTEVSLRQIYSDMPTMFDSIAAFSRYGFVISDMFLVSCDENLRAIEFDCVLVRDRKSQDDTQENQTAPSMAALAS